ncbi:MAG: hypothetical protein IMX04_05040 [Candidatus Carbobacillus altaicus]|nr:hypothetical protein [Candidatus Carbobacillus altaicus]
MIVTKRKVLFMMIPLLILTGGCSVFINKDMSSNKRSINGNLIFLLSFDQSTIEIHQMAIEEKIEKGIDLVYSPDRSSFYVLDGDPPYWFHKIILGPNGNKQIFDYRDFFGSEFRDFHELTVFWGGHSDRLYLASRSGENLNGGTNLWYYDLSEEKWYEADLSFLPQERFRVVTTVDRTPFLIFEYENEYGFKEFYLVDIEQQSKTPIHIPYRAEVLDQHNGTLLFSEVMRNHEQFSEYSLSLFDVSTGSTFPLSMTVPLYGSGKPYAVLIHDSDYISYDTTFVDYRNRGYSNLVITDTKTNQSIVIPNSPGRRWNANFTCLYNDESISCIEKRGIK